MAYNNTAWKFSELEDNKKGKDPVAGNRHLMITGAEYDDHTDPLDPKYVINFKDLDDEEISYPPMKYRMYATNKTTGELFFNSYTRGTLVSLGKALAGPNWKDNALPNPADIKGGVVLAEVQRKPYTNKDGVEKTATNIYVFHPALAEYAACAEIAQYYEGASDEEIQELDAARESA